MCKPERSLPKLVLAMATIRGLSTELGRFTPRFVEPPYGHSVNGIGGVLSGVVGQSARRPGGAEGSDGADG